MKYLYIYLIIFFLFFGCKKSETEEKNYYKKLLEKEFFNKFFKNNKPFISNKEFEELSKIKNKNEFFESLLYLLKNRTVKSKYNFGLYDNIDYEINIDSYFLNNNIEIKEKKNIEYYLKLNNELNKQLYFPSILGLSDGQYKIYYNTIKRYVTNYNDYDKNLLIDFITNLPDPKISILCDYMFLTFYGEGKKIIEKKVYETYNEINSKNYEVLLKKDSLYDQAFKSNKAIYEEMINTRISNIKNYYKLEDLLKKLNK